MINRAVNRIKCVFRGHKYVKKGVLDYQGRCVYCGKERFLSYRLVEDLDKAILDMKIKKFRREADKK